MKLKVKRVTEMFVFYVTIEITHSEQNQHLRSRQNL